MSETRERLAVAAAELIDEGGRSAVTLREVGKRAGVSHNTPYKHFDSKEDLLGCVAAVELRQLSRAIEQSASDLSGLDRVEAAVLVYLTWARAYPARFALTFGAWTDPHEELGQAAAKCRAAMLHTVNTAVAEEPQLSISGEEILSLAWSLAHGAADLDRAGHLRKTEGSPPAEALVGTLMRLVRGGGA